MWILLRNIGNHEMVQWYLKPPGFKLNETIEPSKLWRNGLSKVSAVGGMCLLHANATVVETGHLQQKSCSGRTGVAVTTTPQDLNNTIDQLTQTTVCGNAFPGVTYSNVTTLNRQERRKGTIKTYGTLPLGEPWLSWLHH